MIKQLGFVLGLLIAGVAYGIDQPAGEQQLPPRPNILFAISDDQSWKHAGAYGCKGIDTPAFDRVARQGVLFNNAFAPSPGCSPTRAAVLTGRHIWQIENAGTHASSFPKDYVTFPDLLEEAGYHIGTTGKNWGPGNYRASGRERNPAGPGYNSNKLDDKPYRGVSNRDYAANFEDFLGKRKGDQPFFFWYGAYEPHRGFEKGSWKKAGKKLKDADVPAFLPDTPEVRGDILDYYVEIEHFDKHLGRMIKQLEAAGELENTIIIVTSDNGMAFPRAKANLYEYGVHMPLAISWPAQAPAGRVVDDVVGLIDIAPTILEAARVRHPGKHPMAGRSLMDVLTSEKQGLVDRNNKYTIFGRERHSSSRWHTLGYPGRAIRTQKWLYIHNVTPERWPAGAPRRLGKSGKLGPPHGGYHDIDACPTLDVLIEGRDDPKIAKYFHLAVDHRPQRELYNILEDPACVNNLASDPAYKHVADAMDQRLTRDLEITRDPRIFGRGDIFETYERYSHLRVFPRPDWVDEHPDIVPDQPWLRERLGERYDDPFASQEEPEKPE